MYLRGLWAALLPSIPWLLWQLRCLETSVWAGLFLEAHIGLIAALVA